MNRRAHLVISGMVQGVCFRMYTCDEAMRLGITGWVRNCADGTVEVLAEGSEDILGEFVNWCRHGPSHARVTGFEKRYSDATGEFPSFRITF